MPKVPTTRDEFVARYKGNERVVGRNEMTVTHMPCIFCGAPDFFILPILRVQEVLQAGSICAECGRGARVIFTGDDRDKVQYEVVQTVGIDPPEYLEPAPRRVM